FSREAVGVTAIDEVWRLQDVVAPFGLKPTYVIDYPVATTASSATRLAEIAHRGECQIGAHLHPWVNPPFDEPLGARMSYPCNLGYELEHEKIRMLKSAIEQQLDIQPISYKAGRYGFGATSAAILEDLNFKIDLSVNPHMNFTNDGGPSFEGLEPVPSSFG